MFIPGSKVIVLESSVKNGTGPKRGSIGYVSDISRSLSFEVYNKFNVLAKQCTINFTRYGFEEHNRRERTKIICLFPCTELKHALNLTKVKMEKHRKELNDMLHVAVNVPMTLTAPYFDCENLLTCNDNEFIAWVDSLVWCSEITLNRFSPKLGSEIHALSDSTRYKQAVIDDTLSSVVNRAEFINSIQLELSMYFRTKASEIQKHCEETLSALNNDASLLESRYRSILLNNPGSYLFYPIMKDVMIYMLDHTLSYNKSTFKTVNKGVLENIETYKRMAKELSKVKP